MFCMMMVPIFMFRVSRRHFKDTFLDILIILFALNKDICIHEKEIKQSINLRF